MPQNKILLINHLNFNRGEILSDFATPTDQFRYHLHGCRDRSNRLGNCILYFPVLNCWLLNLMYRPRNLGNGRIYPFPILNRHIPV
jgi:hypothetical protein